MAGPGERLPFFDRIQASFGHHELSRIRAHVGPQSAEGAAAINAAAFTIGDDIAFSRPPSLLLAAHEAAHVVQQRGGLDLPLRVGAVGDRHERHADSVAARVISAQSSESLLDAYATRAGAPSRPSPIQRQHEPPAKKPARSEYSLGDITKQVFQLSVVEVTAEAIENRPVDSARIIGLLKAPLDIAMIIGGIIAVTAAAAVMAPLVAAALIVAGTFAVAAGTVKLIADLMARPDIADQVPGSYSGTVGKLIDQATGNKQQLAEKFLDLAEGLLLPSGGAKPTFGTFVDELAERVDVSSDVAEFVVAVDQSAESTASAHRPSDAGKQPSSDIVGKVSSMRGVLAVLDTIPPSATASDTLAVSADTAATSAARIETPETEPTPSKRAKVVKPSTSNDAKGPLKIHPNYKGIRRIGERLKRVFR